jgi:hypothetical protein
MLDAFGGESAFDHVLYCFPKGTQRNGNYCWPGYGHLNGPRSVYNERNCGYLGITMHEIGHNLGLHHANQYYEYADRTGAMGSSSRQNFGPRSCYNAQKNWHLGWYADKSLDLSNNIYESAWSGRLVAFVDYDKAFDVDAVVIRVGNLYVQYNRARDFNENSRAYRNQAVIVSAPDIDSPPSELLKGIAKEGYSYQNQIIPEAYTYGNFEGTGHDLVFEVCDQVEDGPPDYIHLSIHLDDGIQSSLCSVPLPDISDAPSSRPTTSMQPSSSPAPRALPSSSPSEVPTSSKVPSSSPSNSPTVVPSSSPSSQPSASPTQDCTGKDYQGLVAVNHRFGNRTCAWISTRKVWKTYLCQEGFEAFEQCQETCDSCNAQVQDVSDDGCEDSKKMFYVNDKLPNIRCFWLHHFLERSPHWRDRICAPGQPAYDNCPETCGKCSDTCEDQADKRFYVNRRNGLQDCAWLASRPLWQAKLCGTSHLASLYCNEICNTCPE